MNGQSFSKAEGGSLEMTADATLVCIETLTVLFIFLPDRNSLTLALSSLLLAPEW